MPTVTTPPDQFSLSWGRDGDVGTVRNYGRCRCTAVVENEWVGICKVPGGWYKCGHPSWLPSGGSHLLRFCFPSALGLFESPAGCLQVPDVWFLSPERWGIVWPGIGWEGLERTVSDLSSSQSFLRTLKFSNLSNTRITLWACGDVGGSAPTPRICHSEVLGWGPRLCISSNFPGYASACCCCYGDHAEIHWVRPRTVNSHGLQQNLLLFWVLSVWVVTETQLSPVDMHPKTINGYPSEKPVLLSLAPFYQCFPSSSNSHSMNLLAVPEMDPHSPAPLSLRVLPSSWNDPAFHHTPSLGLLSPSRSRESFPSFRLSSLKAQPRRPASHCGGGR